MSKSGNLIYPLIALGLILYTIGPYLLIVFGVIGIVALVLYFVNKKKENSTEQEKTSETQQYIQKLLVDKRMDFIPEDESKNLIEESKSGDITDIDLAQKFWDTFVKPKGYVGKYKER